MQEGVNKVIPQKQDKVWDCPSTSPGTGTTTSHTHIHPTPKYTPQGPGANKDDENETLKQISGQNGLVELGTDIMQVPCVVGHCNTEYC